MNQETGIPVASFRTEKTTVILEVPRAYCRDCKRTKQVSISFAKPNKRYTRFFESHVLDLLLSMTCRDVAEHLGMSWDTVRNIEKDSLKRHFDKPPLKDMTHIAMDEIAVRKGHEYLTVVMDLKSGRVIFVGDGKGGEALLPLTRRCNFRPLGLPTPNGLRSRKCRRLRRR